MQGSLDLVELVQLLLKKLWLILLVSAVGFLVAFGYTKLLVTPQYSSSVKFYVKADEKTVENINQINAAQKMVDTYIIVLQSDTVLNNVIQAINLNLTADQLKAMLSITSLNDTEVFEITVTSNDPNTSCAIANTFADIGPGQIVEITNAGFVKAFDNATPSTTPSSPNVKMNCIIGAMLGLVLSVLLVVLREMLDVRVKGEEDVKKFYTIPVLGEIPNFSTQFKGGYENYER